VSSVSKRISKNAAKVPEFSGKIEQVLQVGKQLADVASQIRDVNGKLGDLDGLIIELNNVRNLVIESIQDSRAVAVEQERQRFVTVRMLSGGYVGRTLEQTQELEQKFRDQFDANNFASTPDPAQENA
jgi:hypothetical protein